MPVNTEKLSIFWRRLAAASYDLLLVFALLMVLTGLVFLARRGTGFDPTSAWYRTLLLTGWWAYFATSWTLGGQTVGMRAWRLILRRDNGQLPGLALATLRFFTAWISALIAGLGFLYALIDRDGLTWHDRISGTRLALATRSPKAQHGNHRNRQ